jgi:hypothetical protein
VLEGRRESHRLHAGRSERLEREMPGNDEQIRCVHGLPIESIRKVPKGASRVRRGVSDIKEVRAFCSDQKSSNQKCLLLFHIGRYSRTDLKRTTTLVICDKGKERSSKNKVVRVFLNNNKKR